MLHVLWSILSVLMMTFYLSDLEASAGADLRMPKPSRPGQFKSISSDVIDDEANEFHDRSYEDSPLAKKQAKMDRDLEQRIQEILSYVQTLQGKKREDWERVIEIFQTSNKRRALRELELYQSQAGFDRFDQVKIVVLMLALIEMQEPFSSINRFQTPLTISSPSHARARSSIATTASEGRGSVVSDRPIVFSTDLPVGRESENGTPKSKILMPTFHEEESDDDL